MMPVFRRTVPVCAKLEAEVADLAGKMFEKRGFQEVPAHRPLRDQEWSRFDIGDAVFLRWKEEES